jgi:hypothetical protein
MEYLQVNKSTKILALTKKGLKAGAIAKKVGCSENYVYHVRWNHRTGGHAKKRPIAKVGLSKVNVRRLIKAIALLQKAAA